MKISDIFRNNIVSSSASKYTAREEAADSASSISDTLELSEDAQQYAQLNREARASLESAESDEAGRADAVAGQISAGTYQTDLDDVVYRIVNATV